MIFGVLNSEKIWHQYLVHLPTLPVYLATLPWEIQKKSFLTVLRHSVVTHASCDAPVVDYQLSSYTHIRSVVIGTHSMMTTTTTMTMMMKVLCCNNADTLVVFLGFFVKWVYFLW